MYFKIANIYVRAKTKIYNHLTDINLLKEFVYNISYKTLNL